MTDIIERLRIESRREPHEPIWRDAIDEIEALRADLAEPDEIREKLGHLLTRTAEALKGEPLAGVWHSWHDLPEKATQLAERVQRDEALRLADECEESARAWANEIDTRERAAAELRRLHAQAAQDEALLRQALEALEYYRSGEDYQPTPASEAIAAIKERLK